MMFIVYILLLVLDNVLYFNEMLFFNFLKIIYSLFFVSVMFLEVCIIENDKCFVFEGKLVVFWLKRVRWKWVKY